MGRIGAEQSAGPMLLPVVLFYVSETSSSSSAWQVVGIYATKDHVQFTQFWNIEKLSAFTAMNITTSVTTRERNEK